MEEDLWVCPACHAAHPPSVELCPCGGTTLHKTGSPKTPRPVDPFIGQILDGRFQVVEKIGEGGMGTVYRGRQLNVDREVAIKVLLAVDDQAQVARFENEAMVISQLRHPNTLKLIDFGRAGDLQMYIVTELLGGRPLDKVLRDGPLDVRRTADLMGQVLGALEEAHDRGIVHRDLKPGNLFLETFGDREILRVLDFGLAKAAQQSLKTATGIVMGTPAYMSPEQAKGHTVDGRSDLYSLGVVAYQCVTGRTPFDADSVMGVLYKHVHEPPPRLPPHIDPAFESWVMALLEKKASARPETARRARELLGVLSGPTPSLSTPLPAPTPVSAFVPPIASAPSAAILAPPIPPPRRRRWGALAAIAIALIIGATQSLRHPPAPPPAPPPVAPRALTDLPPPASTIPAAIDAYKAAMQTMRDGTWETARLGFKRAVDLDPSMSAGYLRLALAGGINLEDPTKTNELYARAMAGRAALSERDRIFLDALQPILQRNPWDRRECAARLKAMSALFPDDAEPYVLRGWMMPDRPLEALEAGRNAARLDPLYADAWQLEGNALQWLGRLDEAKASYEKCAAISAASGDCLSWMSDLQSGQGDCAGYEATVRRWMDRAPMAGIALAAALHAQGRDRATVEGAVEQSLAPVPDAQRDQMRPFYAIRVALNYGELGKVIEKVRATHAVVAGAPNFQPHYWLLTQGVLAAQESGDEATASELATIFANSADVWRKPNMIMPLQDGYTPYLFKAAKGERAQFAVRQKAWFDQVTQTGGAPLAAAWVFAYAAPAETEEEAKAALAALPPGTDLVPTRGFDRADSAIGRVLLLAGRTDEALPYLERAAKSCRGMLQPVEQIRGFLDLGTAKELVGDTAGACAAYQRAVERWKSPLPRSVSTEKARARVKALHCTK